MSATEMFTRRTVVQGLGCGAGLAGLGLAPFGVGPAFAQDAALHVAENDPRIIVERVNFQAATGPINGYFSKPSKPGRYGAVIIVHSQYGLMRVFQDMVRRLAVENYAVLAPDYFTSAGGTPEDRAKASELAVKWDRDAAARDSKACGEWLRARDDSNGKVATLGFCFGGTIVNNHAATDPSLSAAISYYGYAPATEYVKSIKAPLQLHYADRMIDKRIGDMIEPYRAALTASGKVHEVYVYDGTPHAFAHDPEAPSFRKTEADLAWGRSLAFLKRHMG